MPVQDGATHHLRCRARTLNASRLKSGRGGLRLGVCQITVGPSVKPLWWHEVNDNSFRRLIARIFTTFRLIATRSSRGPPVSQSSNGRDYNAMRLHARRLTSDCPAPSELDLPGYRKMINVGIPVILQPFDRLDPSARMMTTRSLTTGGTRLAR